MRVAALLLLIGCEKSGPVESSPGSATPAAPAPVAPAPIVVDAAIATLPNDAKRTADAAKAADLTFDDEQFAFADMLTAEKPTDGDMQKRRPGVDLAKQLDAVKGAGPAVAVGGGTGGGVRGPSGRISVSSKQALDDTSLTADTVLMKIQSAYMAGLKRCYKAYLDKDAAARGKLALSLTVNETGRSVSVNARGFAAEVDDCVKTMMASWRFPIPKDKDGNATDASFAIVLQLVPD